ncbi:PREDICTED: uncharacterized protein LOC109224287 [Nicotiana attenuata]|uniref:uncharacterized protein LOC109224287 n=1 Tax=Nicotiana attenuata TaxID=49451 RepID=UPI000905CE8A|nr:PREDICTED: uncharacterized protein LOC109224287 [Nicotiana attenuata]
MAWRVQNHAMDLCIPRGENTLLLNIDATKGNTMCTQIPRKFSRDEVVKILPDSWITNYEKLREPEESLQSGEPTFTKRNDKIVSISFDHSHLKKPNKAIFSCQMIQPKDITDTSPEPDGGFFWNIQCIMEEHDWCQHFDKEGKRIWWFKCPFTGHCPWDLSCDCQDCLEDSIGEYDEHHLRHWKRFGLNKTKPTSKKKGKTTKKQFRAKYENKDPSIGSLSGLASQNLIYFTQRLKEEHDFDIEKMVWERKDALVVQKQTKKRRDHGKSSKGSNPKNLMISDQKAPDLYVSQPRNISEEEPPGRNL